MRMGMLWVLSGLLLFSVQLDASARYEGLAGAYTALVDGPDAMFYNPAGLGHVNTATLNYSPYYLVYLS
ncbi:hypothetical protein JXM67_03245, partial [candidate division WOR-3 bacterium]|nr:hypothetical protein [candidate division WOR-3 bacterium]